MKPPSKKLLLLFLLACIFLGFHSKEKILSQRGYSTSYSELFLKARSEAVESSEKTESFIIINKNTLLSLNSPVVQVSLENLKFLGYYWITAYSSSRDETDDTPFITASGTFVRNGIIACPRYLPFGTYVMINDKVYICEDRLHERFSDYFDIWMPSKDAAIKFGKRLEAVYLAN